MTFNINKILLVCALAVNMFFSEAADIKDWNVGPGEVVNGTVSSEGFKVKHEIGDEPDAIKLLMYAKGCDEENQEAIDNPYISLSKPDDVCWEGDFQYQVNVNLTMLNNDNPFYDEAAKTLVFCTRATSIELDGDDQLLVNFHRTKFTLDLTLDEVAFEVTTFGVDENDVTEQDVDIVSDDYTITACICDSESTTCETDNVMYNQDDMVYICLVPSQPGVEITTFSLQMTRFGETYDPVKMGPDEEDPNAITDVTRPQTTNDINVVRINTPIIERLVDASDDPTKLIKCTGLANMDFVSGTDGRAGRNLGMFEVDISVQVDKGCEGEGSLGQMISATLLEGSRLLNL